MQLFCNLTNTDHDDYQNMIFDNIADELMENPMLYIYPDIAELLTEILFDHYYDLWLDMDLCDEEDEEDVFNYLYTFVLLFFEYQKQKQGQIYFPMRSQTLSLQMENKDYLTKQIDHLRSIPQPTQRTEEWYNFRHGLLTASNVWKVFASESSRNSLIYEKCKVRDDKAGNIYSASMQWGNIFEPVSIEIYEKKFQTKVEDFGCIKHGTYDFIGASPDGINVDLSSNKYGRMLEVKNIYNRSINGIPKKEYWIQIQLQLETCGLEYCDFLETRFKEFENTDEFYEKKYEYQGIVLHFVQNREWKYQYLPLDFPCNKNSVELWKAQTINDMKDQSYGYVRECYYYLEEFSCVEVRRNKLWFQCACPLIAETWDVIVEERVSGYEHRAPKPKVYMSTESDSRVLHNINEKTKFDLIKLA